MNLSETIKKLEHFDSLVFALLTRQKTIVVGLGQQADDFSNNIQQLLPDNLRNSIRYLSGEKSLDTDSTLIGVEMNEETMKLLDKTGGKHTVVFLPNSEVYGQFTSPFCKKIAQLLQEDKLSKLKEELSIFYDKAIESDEITTPADYMAIHGLNKADASLLLWMRALHYGIEVDKTLFSNMEW